MREVITAEEVQRLLELGVDVEVLDIRPRQAFDADEGMIPGARWCDPERVSEWALHLTADRRVILYCVQGRKVSQDVWAALRAHKLDACYIEGGITAWRACGGRILAKRTDAKPLRVM